MEAHYDPVPVALPRRWLADWMLNLWNIAFGHSLGSIQPFRWLMFRELTARERMKMLEHQQIGARVNA